MADPVEIDEIFPSEGFIDADDVLDASTDDLESVLTDEDVEVVEFLPAGRSWSFNFQEGRFNQDGGAPTVVTGDQAVVVWIEKCLSTAEGAATVHPPGYGMRKPITDYLGGDPYDLEEVEGDIVEAVTFHPDIVELTDFQVVYGQSGDAGELAAEISFVAIRSDGQAVDFETEVIV